MTDALTPDLAGSPVLSVLALWHLGLGGGAVLLLAALLLALGRQASRCPVNGAAVAGAATAASLGVAGAYLAIGAGVVLLGAGVAPSATAEFAGGGLTTLGFTVVTLGVGFSIAAATLRNTLENLLNRAQTGAAASAAQTGTDAPTVSWAPSAP